MPPAGVPGPSWDELASHRDDLLRVARRRTSSPEAAEDAVQEALARAAMHWDSIDANRLGAWLTSVTIRVCADQHRDGMTERRHLSRLVQPETGPDPGDEVSDRAEDAWLLDQLTELPSRQQQVLRAMAAAGSVPAAAQRLGMSRQSTESVLKRTRAVMRSRLAATLAALGVLRWRRLTPWRQGGAAAGLAAVALIVAVLPQVAPWFTGRHPASPARSAPADEIATTMPASTAVAQARRPPGRAQSLPREAHTAVAQGRSVALVPAHDVAVGPWHHHDHGVVVTHPHDSLVRSVKDCLRDGVVVSTTYVGCRAAELSLPE
jgi:RNA polymerase sigma factor (sigma-70 family)